MTRHETPTRATISAKHMVLATDLDGTFLGGEDEDRSALYAWIETHRETVGLVFVTGRDPRFIADLTDGTGVPRPDYVVGDVGTTIAEVGPEGDIRPIPALEAEIAQGWNDAGDRVRTALEGAAGLTLQPTAFRYRVSYDLDLETFDARTVAMVEAMGFDVLISDDRFFDVLPRGISKGPSLARLIDHLGVRPETCLVAGDTMNDLSMLALGLPAVAVGGSEPRLIEALKPHAHVHRATARGAAGIREAIRAFDLHPHA
ncbi:HAD-IIB family hydrolase [Palleronia sp. KMU-117]|uniref:HAD-IIB family hydrolase n=1 Tax=Palleronia sp. KMU-117 TaxID=3434108 RepID=UPI003D765A79